MPAVLQDIIFQEPLVESRERILTLDGRRPKLTKRGPSVEDELWLEVDSLSLPEKVTDDSIDAVIAGRMSVNGMNGSSFSSLLGVSVRESLTPDRLE